ncbi:MAG: hypothetical protein JNG89_06560 [Planctomycetaceae bacterium]|nr:hypothetical protein [Planctomycetaceae bacterium]
MTNNSLSDTVGSKPATGQTPFVLFMMGALFLLLGPHGKIVPGGPFISLTGEALPIALFAASIVTAVRGLRRSPVWLLLAAWSVLSAAGIGFVLDGIVRFWFRPYARGDLLGL